MLALLALSPTTLRAGDNGARPGRAAVYLSMGSQDVLFEGRCLRMSATLVDSSLAKLRKKKVAVGTEFHRGKIIVDRFPDELMVEVTVTDCVAPFAVAVGKFFGTLQFSAVWRRGSDERPCEVYVPRDRPESLETSDTFRVYNLSVPSADVPLTDHLVLNVSAEGKRIAQFVNDL
jgi:hypothetical protein